MVQLLYKYLILHKSANVPDIGTFYISRVPARLDFANKLFTAPDYQINFKADSFTGNNLMYTYIAKEKKIAETDASEHYNNFAKTIRKKLEEQQSVELPGLGVLHQNEEGALHFKAVLPLYNYFPAAVAERLIREDNEHHILVGDSDRTNTQMKEMLVDEPELPQSKDYWWIFAIALGLIGIATIVYYYLHNGSLR